MEREASKCPLHARNKQGMIQRSCSKYVPGITLMWSKPLQSDVSQSGKDELTMASGEAGQISCPILKKVDREALTPDSNFGPSMKTALTKPCNISGVTLLWCLITGIALKLANNATKQGEKRQKNKRFRFHAATLPPGFPPLEGLRGCMLS